LFKKGRVQGKTHIGSTFERDNKELDPRRACKYLSTEDSPDIKDENETEKFKKEYLRRLR
jgi:chromosomal replication initiation ATPase DnaA